MQTLWDPKDLHVLYSEVFPVLQLHAIDEPIFSNLKCIKLRWTTGGIIPFIPLFLSPRTTVVDIEFDKPELPVAIVASMVTNLPTLCPNLQAITLRPLPRDPKITEAVSGMFLANNRNSFRCIRVDSPLTEAAREVVYNLPDLQELLVAIERDTLLPSVVLPNLANLTIKYDHDFNWLQGFRRATLGKLALVDIRPGSASIGNFLEAFESVAVTTSIPATLSTFRFRTSHQWRPNYHSLLLFTQLKELDIGFSCESGCSSTIDDDAITDIARAMPLLEDLSLGGRPCQTPTGVTVKGLAALAHHCPHLSNLCIHLQVATLDPSAIPGVISDGEPTVLQEECALTRLNVGNIPVSEESTSVVALTLLRIFPHIKYIVHLDRGWRKVKDVISLSK